MEKIGEASHKIKEEYYRKITLIVFQLTCQITKMALLKNYTLSLETEEYTQKPLPNNEIDKKIKPYFDNVKELLARLIVLAKESNLLMKI